MIIVKGQGATAAELPIGPQAARTYFADVPSFLNKIEAVSGVKALGRPGTYLITHHPMGALNYMVVMVSCAEATWHDGGLSLRPLDFDTDQVKCDHPVVKGYIESDLVLAPRASDKTYADFRFDVRVELPIKGAITLLPRPLVQATADGIMSLRVSMVVKSLFNAVAADLRLGSASGVA